MKNLNRSIFAKHANTSATKGATIRSIVKLKNISKTLLNRCMFAKHVNIAAIKRATMCSIVKRKNISNIQKKSLRTQTI